MMRQIRLFNHQGDTVLAEYEEGVLTEEAKTEFDKLMADINLNVIDEQLEAPAKTFDPSHDYVAFRKMAGG